MKPKKKTSTTVKKGGKKPLAAKPIMLFDKTIVTTKEKTYTTIEDHFQMGDVRNSFRSNKAITPRTLCQQKMEQCNLSPFSSNGASSVSPKYRKIHSPRPKDEKEPKKTKARQGPPHEKMVEKKKGETMKREIRAVPKMTKEQQNQSAYQMLLLKRLNEKKITEMSEESSISIPKFSKLQLNVVHTLEAKPLPSNSSAQVIKQLKQKIRQKYKKQFPGLKKVELRFLCSIVLIQRCWRQRRIKNFISQFFTPRTDQNITADSHKETNLSKLLGTNSTQQLTSQLIKKYHYLNISSEKPKNIDKQMNSTQMETTKKEEKQINLKDLELSAELTPQRQDKMIKFVECLRDISYFKKKKSENRSKINVFNLQQSLSQKCLMQKFYEKVFKDGEGKKNNFEIFNSKKDEKNLERSIELINTMKSPQKAEIIQIEERLQTQLQEIEPAPIERVEVSVETENFALEDKSSTQISTLKQLSLVSEGVIFMLLNEFSEQFYSFTSRTVLRKKKKARLPGLKVTSFSIRQYLTGLTSYMLENYDVEVLRRFCLIKPLNFLKIHHQYDQDDEIDDEEDEEYNMPIVPNTLFYQYQLIYEEKKFTIAEEDKKYCNFLEGLIKIHNLLLANCLSQILQKARIDRVILPWDKKFEPERSCNKKKYSKHDLQVDLNKIIDGICHSAFMRVGQFHKRLDDPEEERKILKSVNQQYKAEGNDWSAQYQYLEMRMELTKCIEEQLLNQVVKDLMIFF